MDECLSGRHNCQYRCVNTVGSFRCDCPEGYVKSGMTCVGEEYPQLLSDQRDAAELDQSVPIEVFV